LVVDDENPNGTRWRGVWAKGHRTVGHLLTRE
jgi:hypothetical protein